MISLNWADFITTKNNRVLSLQYYNKGENYIVIMKDGYLAFSCELLDEDEILDFETNYKSASNVRLGEAVAKTPFDSKKLSDGRSLFRRKHGVKQSVPANSVVSITIDVPYAECKIDEVEIVNCTGADTINLRIKDNATGTFSGVPDYVLNQFGFDVNLADLYYTDTSNYDATLYQTMVIEVEYANNEANSKSIGVNFVLHEVV